MPRIHDASLRGIDEPMQPAEALLLSSPSTLAAESPFTYYFFVGITIFETVMVSPFMSPVSRTV